MLIILKILFLLLAVLYGFSNLIKAYYKNDIGSVQVFLMAIGIVGFAVLQFRLY